MKKFFCLIAVFVFCLPVFHFAPTGFNSVSIGNITAELQAAEKNSPLSDSKKPTTKRSSANERSVQSSDALCVNSQKARKSPDWVQNGIVYQVNTRAFSPEGTIRGALKNLPVLKEAGVTIIYFCPLFLADDDMRQKYWSPRQIKSGLNNPRNPYRLKDYDQIDPEYGTEEDVKEFVKAAHRLGMRVIFDLVYLHCGPTGVLVSSHPEYFLYEKNGKMKMTIWNFPMFDFSKKETREYFWSNMTKWVKECDIDGYRCDVSDGIPLDFWCEGRRRLEKIKPEIALLAEGQKRVEDQIFAFDMNYNFSLGSLLEKVYMNDLGALEIRKLLEKMSAERPHGFRFIRYIDNHDISNDDYQQRKDTKWTVKGVDAALVLLYSLDGVPMLYCGQEIADISRHSLYGNKTFGNCVIDWTRLTQPIGQKRLALCKKLAEMRRSDPIFSGGQTIWLDNDRPNSVLSFLREKDGRKILVLVNMKRSPAEVNIDLNYVNIGNNIHDSNNVNKDNNKILLPAGDQVGDDDNSPCVKETVLFSNIVGGKDNYYQLPPFGYLIKKLN